MKPLCHALAPLSVWSVSAIYHLRLCTKIKLRGCCCCSSYGRLLMFYLAVRSLRLFITNRATALYEFPQAQHHTIFWYSTATVLVCHYKKKCCIIKDTKNKTKKKTTKQKKGHCHILSENAAWKTNCRRTAPWAQVSFCPVFSQRELCVA